LFGGGQSYGGSTLTQQTIKNLTDDNEVSFNRKIREIDRSLKIENHLSKDQILEIYLNKVNFGSGCFGVQSASMEYFGKDISECSIAECAAIAGITKNPAAFSPLAFPQKNKKRRELVISELYSQHMISEQEYDEAMIESAGMTFKSHADLEDSEVAVHVHNWYVESMIKELTRDLSDKLDIGLKAASEMVRKKGLKIYCAMDERAQNIAEATILDSSVMPSDPKIQVGYTMMDLKGRVLATVGSRDKKTGNLWKDRANDEKCKRQPGSSIKPISVYAPAMDLDLCTYSSFISNEKIPNFYGEGKPGPNNWNHSSGGTVTTIKALEQSLNIPPVHLLQKLTLPKSCDFLTKKLGITLDQNDTYSLSALANGGMTHGTTPKEMAGACQIFGNSGIYYKPYKYFYVTDNKGKIIIDNRDKPGIQAIRPATATIMNHSLRHFITNGLGRKADISGWNIIGKTGTTNDDKESWFVGLSPYTTSCICVGYEPAKRISNPGSAAMAPWRAIQQKYLSALAQKDYDFDSNVIRCNYCSSSGQPAKTGCPVGGSGYYEKNHMSYCKLHEGAVDSYQNTPEPPPEKEQNLEPENEPASEPQNEPEET
jgi:penicillin-binding protein 1A